MRHLFLILSFVSVLGSFQLHAQPDPVGQKAHYLLDTDPKRTSSMIQSGSMDAFVNQLVTNENGEPAYEVLLSYKFNIQFVGLKEGLERPLIDKHYFDEEFLINLRETGYYESPNFKAKHLGYTNTTTLNKKTYKNCDKIFLYDIQETTVFRQMAESILSEEIEDLVGLALISPGVPVLGAVKLDLSGTYQGLPVKAGGDYID